jgi:hypothetical protein
MERMCKIQTGNLSALLGWNADIPYVGCNPVIIINYNLPFLGD